MIDDQELVFIHVEQENITATFLNYGAAIYDIFVPDALGKMEGVVITYQELSSYIQNKRHLNATIGPTAGRIKDAMFTIGSKTHHIDPNFAEKHTLHGGKDALSYTLFDYQVVEEENQSEIIFKTRKKAGEQLYPGNQQYTIIYTVSSGTITIEYVAETDYPSLVNLTNHAYFNLSGNLKTNILHHEMRIRAIQAMTLDSEMIPYGVHTITNTPLDFTSLRPINKPSFVEIDDPYILTDCTLDHPQATLIDPTTKRRLDVYTTYPAIVCYTDNFPMTYNLAYGAKNERYMGVCFEAQNPPNGLVVEGVESSILHPDERYYHKTIYRFSIEE